MTNKERKRLHEILDELIEDSGGWAKIDSQARDGIYLVKKDLYEYIGEAVAQKMTEPLMDEYRKELAVADFLADNKLDEDTHVCRTHIRLMVKGARHYFCEECSRERRRWAYSRKTEDSKCRHGVHKRSTSKYARNCQDCERLRNKERKEKAA